MAMWDQLGECLSDALTRQDSLRKQREAARAWISLVSFVVDNMKQGYQRDLYRRKSATFETAQSQM